MHACKPEAAAGGRLTCWRLEAALNSYHLITSTVIISLRVAPYAHALAILQAGFIASAPETARPDGSAAWAQARGLQDPPRGRQPHLTARHRSIPVPKRIEVCFGVAHLHGLSYWQPC